MAKNVNFGYYGMDSKIVVTLPGPDQEQEEIFVSEEPIRSQKDARNDLESAIHKLSSVVKRRPVNLSFHNYFKNYKDLIHSYVENHDIKVKKYSFSE